MNSQFVRRIVTSLAFSVLLGASLFPATLSMAAPLEQKGGTAPILIAYGETVVGSIDNRLYEQAYVFDGQAGDVVTISMVSLDNTLDSYLVLYDAYPSQNPLASDDDSGGNGNALINGYQLPATGRYYIVATRYGRQTGEAPAAITSRLSCGAGRSPASPALNATARWRIPQPW